LKIQSPKLYLSFLSLNPQNKFTRGISWCPS
jgi:hypothetical protein